MKKLINAVPDVLIVCGAITLSFGAGILHLAAGFLVAGTLMIAGGVIAAGKPKKQEDAD
jgi:hypothetical protein